MIFILSTRVATLASIEILCCLFQETAMSIKIWMRECLRFSFLSNTFTNKNAFIFFALFQMVSSGSRWFLRQLSKFWFTQTVHRGGTLIFFYKKKNSFNLQNNNSNEIIPRFQGREYCFISNIDNLGATVDLSVLNLLLKQSLSGSPCEFLMEVTDKTRADVKVILHFALKLTSRD